MEYVIENVVINVRFNGKIDINKLLEKLPTAEYEPSIFPGVITEVNGVKCLFFSSGKVVMSGFIKKTPSSEADKVLSKEYIERVIRERVVKPLRELGIEIPEDFTFKIVNTVSVTQFNKEIDLNKIAEQKDKLIKEFKLKKILYEPKRFPGLRISLGDDIGTTALIFRSGKAVIAGAKTKEKIEKSIEKLTKVLKKAGVL
jgi:transcription initiation factor TFIID TATA-box-binding protein